MLDFWSCVAGWVVVAKRMRESSPCILLYLRIHDVIPFAANKSSALCVARTMCSTCGSSSCSGSSFGASSNDGGCCLGRGCSLRARWGHGGWLGSVSRVVFRLAVGVVGVRRRQYRRRSRRAQLRDLYVFLSLSV